MAFGPKVSEVSKTTSVVGGYLVLAGLISYYSRRISTFVRTICMSVSTTLYPFSRCCLLHHRRDSFWTAMRQPHQSLRMVQARHAHTLELHPTSLTNHHRHPGILQRGQFAKKVHQDRMAIIGDGLVPNHDVRMTPHWTASLGHHS